MCAVNERTFLKVNPVITRIPFREAEFVIQIIYLQTPRKKPEFKLNTFEGDYSSFLSSLDSMIN